MFISERGRIVRNSLALVSDADLSVAMIDLQRQLARLEAQAARIAAEWDQRKAWRASGARNGAAWLTAKTHLPADQARRRLRLGRVARRHPIVGAAWAAGDIDATHVSVLGACAGKRTAAAFDRDEKTLVDAARTLSFKKFTRRIDYWKLRADPDGAEDRAARHHDQREVHLAESIFGLWLGRITLDPLGGTIVNTTLRAIEDRLIQADWAHTKAALGRDPLPAELPRTPAQRRADALVEMATLARATEPGDRRPEPLFTVFCGYQRFQDLCELAYGPVMPPETLAPWLTRAWVERVVFDSPSRVIDLGCARPFTGGARRAALLQSDECYHHLCDEPADAAKPTTSNPVPPAAPPTPPTAAPPAATTTASATEDPNPTRDRAGAVERSDGNEQALLERAPMTTTIAAVLADVRNAVRPRGVPARQRHLDPPLNLGHCLPSHARRRLTELRRALPRK